MAAAEPPRLVAVSPVPDVAGGETALLRLLPELAGRGWRLTLTTPGPGRLAAAAGELGVPIRRLPLGPPERRTVASWAGAIGALAALRGADVCLLNGLPAQRVVPALALLRRPAVLRVNNPLSSPPRAWGRARLWRVVRAVAADSEHTARECVAAGAPADRVEACLPAAWAGPEGPPAARPGAGEELVVGFLGRLEPRKGLEVLLEAAGRVLPSRPAARLVVAGEAPPGGETHAARLGELARGLGDRVELLGFTAEAPRLLAGLDLVCVPSHAEPFGTIAAEAAAAGVPVLASAVGGLREVVVDGETGVLVPPGDPEALARELGSLLDDRARLQRLGAEARRRSARFSPAAYADAMDALLRRALREGVAR